MEIRCIDKNVKEHCHVHKQIRRKTNDFAFLCWNESCNKTKVNASFGNTETTVRMKHSL